MRSELDKEKLRTIFNHYGEGHQLEKLAEETKELYKELKEVRETHCGPAARQDIFEEMADVLVLISQFMEVPAYRELIIKTARQKIDRELGRMKT